MYLYPCIYAIELINDSIHTLYSIDLHNISHIATYAENTTICS